MITKKCLSSAALAGIFAASVSSLTPMASASHHEGKKKEGYCHGVNSCKGKSACHTANSDCTGKNGCAGKGKIKMSKKDCEKAILKKARSQGMKFEG